MFTSSSKYYILTSDTNYSREWKKIPSIVTPKYVYFPKGAVAVFSDLNQAGLIIGKGNPLELVCLVCFFHILRKEIRLTRSLIDSQYEIEIKAWRMPCETTAYYSSNDGNDYYLEGCREKGVFWRNKSELPKTESPLVSCGALDQNGGCWGAQCPFGLYVPE